MDRNYEDKEKIISIKDLLMNICLKWKFMIVWAVIFALLLDGVGIVKDYLDLREYRQNEMMSSEEIAETNLIQSRKKVEELKKGLSLREQEEVSLAFESYKNIEVRYNNLLTYSQESIKMQLDPNNIPMISLQYNVNNHYEAVYPVITSKDNTQDIIAAIRLKITSEEVCEKVAEALSVETEAAYVKELISPISSSDNNSFTITVVAPTKEDCEKTAEIVKECIKEYKNDLEGKFGEFDLNFVNAVYCEGQNTAILNDQTNQASSINAMKNAFGNLVYGMSEPQKKYFYALLDSDNLENMEKTISEGTSLEESVVDEDMPIIDYIHAKLMIVGFILGIFVVVFIEGMKYLLTGKLRVSADLKDNFGLTILGAVKSEKINKSCKIDIWIRSLFSGADFFTHDERMRMICAGIRIASEKCGYKNIYITSVCNDKEVQGIVKEITGKFKSTGVNAESGLSILCDPESFENVSKADGVVVVEKIGGSIYTDIQNELEKCSSINIPIIGCVVIE